MKIKKKTLFHYAIIYLMLIANQSNFSHIFVERKLWAEIPLIVLVLIALQRRNNRTSQAGIVICGVLLFFTALTRLRVGGVGLLFWDEMALKILITELAVIYDTKKFIPRFLKVVYVLAFISLLGWTQQIAGVDIFSRLFPGFDTINTYATYDTGLRQVFHYSVHGLLLYSTLSFYPTRNAGFFSEPGIFQMVLNSALFLVLYLSESTGLSKRKQRQYAAVFVMAILTSQSTSGYFGLIVIIMGIFLGQNRDDTKSWRTYSAAFIFAVPILLGVDYAVRGSGSLIETAIFSKVFNTSNSFDINADTGKYRVASIVMALLAMLRHPLGLGWDKWTQFSGENTLAGPGGFPFKMGAIIGVLPLTLAMVWLFRPLRHLDGGWISRLVLVFLYFNTTLAQSSAFYPALIIVPIWLEVSHSSRNQKR